MSYLTDFASGSLMQSAMETALNTLRLREGRPFGIPYDTGNLCWNGVTMERRSPLTYVIYVDEDFAPYMPYTNEPWISRKGRNPNQGWWERKVVKVANAVREALDAEEKK